MTEMYNLEQRIRTGVRPEDLPGVSGGAIGTSPVYSKIDSIANAEAVIAQVEERIVRLLLKNGLDPKEYGLQYGATANTGHNYYGIWSEDAPGVGAQIGMCIAGLVMMGDMIANDSAGIIDSLPIVCGAGISLGCLVGSLVAITVDLYHGHSARDIFSSLKETRSYERCE
ncbi:hypothetical protein HYS47_03800 [Candidatus Woesearchaeota archaeon]|nr:hypothetical protein [Candidatus Woesearchaeota archaeon]